jgi:hypothetical protein
MATTPKVIQTILKGQGLVKLERGFREIPEGLSAKAQRAAELAAVKAQYSGLSKANISTLQRIVRDSIDLSNKILEGGRSKAGLRSGIPVVPGLKFNDQNSASIRYSVAVDVIDRTTGIRRYITPNLLSNKAMNLAEIVEMINTKVLANIQASPGLQKIVQPNELTVLQVHRVLALGN